MSEPASTHALDPGAWLERHGDALFRFARARVGSHELAEDLVQEALLAAIQSASTFDGRSSELTWLTGILRHKTYDALRRKVRESTWQESIRNELASDAPQFKDGFWRDRPWTCAEPTPTERAELVEEMWKGLDTLPDSMRQVFLLREVDQVPTDEICSLLGISRQNVWTLLHRAKLRLRSHLGERLNPDSPKGRPA